MTAGPLEVKLLNDFSIFDTEQKWIAVQVESSCSFFQSWHWVGPWLDHICTIQDTVLVEFHDKNRLVGLCFLEKYTCYRRGLFRVTVSSLNESIRPGRHMCSEYNLPLCVSGYEEEVFSALENMDLAVLACDEFQLGRAYIPSSAGIKRLQEKQHCILESELAWGIDLTIVENTVDGFIAGMKKKRRWQIRRSMRQYELQGGLNMQVASSTKQALEFFNELDELHTRRWKSVGLQGTFANPLRRAFVVDIIDKGFDQGVIQLIKLTAGGRKIGYILNFVWRKIVYVLQSGFDLSHSRYELPGYISHIYAATYNHSIGHIYYDFMTGESLYKTLLSNQTKELYNITFQRDNFKIRSENTLLAIYRCLNPMIHKNTVS